MDKVRIVIPLFKSLSKLEAVSLRQCFNILKAYPISLAVPEGFDSSEVVTIANECFKEISIEVFETNFFHGIAGYNNLMMSIKFYSRFEDSRYILIYQTDAFVFRDVLEYWCNLNYDYVAAPWPFDVSAWVNIYPKEIQLYCKFFGRNSLSRTGNGGLSLRKTKSFKSNLRLFSSAVRRWTLNEDMFFSHYVNTLNPFFRIPHPDISRRFAFDVDPGGFYEKNNQELPFGSHGWYRNDADYEGNLEFYRKFVESYGYKIDPETEFL